MINSYYSPFNIDLNLGLPNKICVHVKQKILEDVICYWIPLIINYRFQCRPPKNPLLFQFY